MKKIKIQKGWYYSAGSKFGWNGQFETAGIGINIHDLKAHKALVINVEGNDYYITSQDAIDFIMKFKSILTLGKTKVGIISKGLLRQLTNPNAESIEVQEVIKETIYEQKSLFQ